MSDRNHPPFRCVTCEIEIAGPVTFHVGLPFCCAGCVASGPCTCSYDQPADDIAAAPEPALVIEAADVRHCLDIEAAMADEGLDRTREATLASRR